MAMRKREKCLHATGIALAFLYWSASSQARAEAPFEAPLRAAIERAAASVPGRVEVEILLRETPPALAGCRLVEPFVPEGARLWGRTAIGARCLDGPAGSAMVPVAVRVYGPALVATRALPANRPIDAADLASAEVELTAQVSPVASRPEQVAGRLPSRPVAAGAPLRLDALRAPPAISAGDLVRVVYKGEGFSVSAEGRALATAAEGQPVRVQTESGRLLAGTARAGRVVELKGP